MSALDTAKDIARIASTAGLGKDVIDLLEKKAALLTEEIASLRAKVSRLETENTDLRQQLQRAQPQSDGFVESTGVLWKRTATGFESHPYCKHCAGNPVMSPIRTARQWVCGTGEHIAPMSVSPPTA